MSIIYQTNKKTGIIYAYESKAYWDKEKKQSRAKRTLIGKIDPDSGKIIPTREYRKQTKPAIESPAKPGPVPMLKTQRSFFGENYLLDQIGKETGVEVDLKACFPGQYKKILSLAYYLILEKNNSLSRFSHWQRLHIHPFGDDISSQRSSELFQSIEES
ncbi:MAG: hypothetical protein PHZ09_07465 [Eubacteriales bacterium]|nr:hypothetical protein [Eubacteriales bacterium]